jgi:hypothetical protein
LKCEKVQKLWSYRAGSYTFSPFNFLTLLLPAISAAVSATATAAAASAAASAASTIFTRPCFIDYHIPAVILLAVELGDRVVGIVFGSHFHEPKSTRSAGLPVKNNICGFDRAGRRKILVQIFTCHAKRQVSNVKFITHFSYFS